MSRRACTIRAPSVHHFRTIDRTIDVSSAHHARTGKECRALEPYPSKWNDFHRRSRASAGLSGESLS
ncbi:MAG TPA: hypothetical protein VF113_17190, partial [Stellaceae bacterium]